MYCNWHKNHSELCIWGEQHQAHPWRGICAQEEVSRKGSIRGDGTFLQKSSNYLKNIRMYIHGSQLCLRCGLEMRIYKNQILEKILINHRIQSFNEYLIQAPNTAGCQFFSA